ncbi:hypothetical protein MTO96_012121 [Rhipicephalus appendiculatus]
MNLRDFAINTRAPPCFCHVHVFPSSIFFNSYEGGHITHPARVYCRAAVNSLFNDGEAVTVRNELLRQKEDDGALLPDQEEYLDDVNRMEVCNNELKATEKQIEVIRKEVQELSNDCEELAQLYQDRDNLLDTIISKTSGSELECQLALDLEKLHICKQQVDLTHFKWSQALLMVRQACSQFSRALKKWKDLDTVPERHVPREASHFL